MRRLLTSEYVSVSLISPEPGDLAQSWAASASLPVLPQGSCCYDTAVRFEIRNSNGEDEPCIRI
jgi:hypothetical protein